MNGANLRLAAVADIHCTKTNHDYLRDLFTQAGTVTSVVVIKDRDTGQSKGFGFIEMSSQSEVEKAISMFNGYKLNERPLNVSIARPREERGGFGDRRGGGGGGGGGFGGRRDRDRRGGGLRR